MRILPTGMSRLWKRPWLLLLVLAVLSGAAVGGAHLWAWHHFAAGRRALENYRAAEARDHLEQALRVWGSSVETHRLAARAARRAGDLVEAERHLDECRRLGEGDGSIDVATEWALLRAASGDLAAAEDYLRKRLEKVPAEAPLIWEALAEGYRRLSRPHEALGCLEQWLAYDPGSVQAVFLRARIHHSLRAVKKAAEDYAVVVERDPRRDDARRPLAGCLVQIGRYEEALRHLGLLQQQYPGDADLRVLAARCRYNLGERDDAMRLLDQLLAEAPKHGPALRERGRMELAAERASAAEDLLRRAVAALPRDYDAAWALYESLRTQGKTAEAAAQLAVAQRLKNALERVGEIQTHEMSKRPFDPDLQRELGALLLWLGDRASAERWLLSALRLAHGRHRAAHLALADLYLQTGDADKAALHRRQAEESPAPPPR